MSDFRVVDLWGQAEAVARHTQGWSKAQVLDWLGQFGKITQLDYGYPDIFVFHPPSGLDTGFVWRDNGKFLLIGDNTTVPIQGPKGDDA